MTLIQINSLSAGPETDALISHYCFGHLAGEDRGTLKAYHPTGAPSPSSTYTCESCGIVFHPGDLRIQVPKRQIFNDGQDYVHVCPDPPYSTSMEAAWLLMEKYSGLEMRIAGLAGLTRDEVFSLSAYKRDTVDDEFITLPLDICKAALKFAIRQKK